MEVIFQKKQITKTKTQQSPDRRPASDTFDRSTSVMVGFPFRRVPHWCNGKSLGGWVLHGRVDAVLGVGGAG